MTFPLYNLFARTCPSVCQITRRVFGRDLETEFESTELLVIGVDTYAAPHSS